MTTSAPQEKARIRIGRVLLVDDHPVVRRGFAQAIDGVDDLEVCGEAGTMADALKQIAGTQPNVVVVDLSLEDGSGIDLIKQIVANDEGAKVLVASMHDEQLYAERALRAGAKGYIRKDKSLERLVEAIRQVLRGRIFLSSEMADQLLNRVITGDDDPKQSPVDTLSDRELEVFQHFGRGLTTRQVAEALHLSPKTIETHREHIKKKLGIKNNNQLIRCATQWMLEQQ